ncbi:MAG TPA: Ni/Fe-hydrogenase cytochrome b subunit [Thermoanaerobaculaceae bacterium]|nr:Ni/Fe-hydrogenase cytochrome b subunit [Thermoanaerobaculaceae bacterium]HRS17077.1 Ni/Fe-hydrogenase cytochrome b subunit [Thermoanaerobaculaceae bacterium]
MREANDHTVRLGFWTVVSGFLLLALGIIAVIRFTRGIGAVTNLSDQFPWGLWIGFDVLCGVGLAAGGFAITATVHILHLDDFKPIVRPTVLTAYLGYLLVILGLVFDLGKPWNIWHPIIMWNPHSVMFEVGWCVMLYTTVLTFEFSPVVLERFRLHKLLGMVKTLTPVAVVLGVILSTLHQSSLGSLFLILPHKMHPLWYSPLLPVLFFVSALAAGLGMTVVESFFSRRVFGRAIETQVLDRLSRASVVVLSVYLLLRLRDLHVRDALRTLWPLTGEAWMFIAEVGLGVALPLVLLASERFRRSPGRLAWAHGAVVLGFVFHRLNVAVTSIEAATGQRYVPAIAEFGVSLGLVALGMWAFVLACRFFPIFPEKAKEAEPARDAVPAPIGGTPVAGAESGP